MTDAELDTAWEPVDDWLDTAVKKKLAVFFNDHATPALERAMENALLDLSKTALARYRHNRTATAVQRGKIAVETIQGAARLFGTGRPGSIADLVIDEEIREMRVRLRQLEKAAKQKVIHVVEVWVDVEDPTKICCTFRPVWEWAAMMEADAELFAAKARQYHDLTARPRVPGNATC